MSRDHGLRGWAAACQVVLATVALTALAGRPALATMSLLQLPSPLPPPPAKSPPGYGTLRAAGASTNDGQVRDVVAPRTAVTMSATVCSKPASPRSRVCRL